MSEFNDFNDNSESEKEVNVEIINQSNALKKDKKKKKKPKSNNTSNNTSKQSAMGKIILEMRKKQEEEEARIKAINDEEERKIKEEEEKKAEYEKKIKEEQEKKRKAKQDKINKQKENLTYKTKSEKEKEKKNKEKLEQLKLLGIVTTDNQIIFKQDNFNAKLSKKINLNESDIEDINKIEDININTNKIEDNFRCPILTILGHVDTGKTSLLDNLRESNVQQKETAGITQQIGSTLLTHDIILKRTKFIDKNNTLNIKIPGLLLLDTPGHETFINLRKRGSKLADIVIVIIDLVHGLETQTIESIKLLIESKVPFICALNKIDRLYGWNKNIINKPIQEIISEHNLNTQSEFESRYEKIKIQIMELGLNCELFWKNKSFEDTINICVCSALTGQGIGDLINCVIIQTQTILKNQIIVKSEFDCVVMEVTNIENYGYTIDCILKNGKLTIGDIINIQSSIPSEIITTQVKNILTVPYNRETKSTSISQYIFNKSITGTVGIKIIANNLEKTLIGTNIILGTMEEYNICDKSNSNTNLSFELDPLGICLYTSSQGSAEALIDFLRKEKEFSILISQVNIGSVMKKDLIKLLLNNKDNSTLEYMCVLVFDVKISEDAELYAKENKIKIFQDNTIFRLYEQYKKYLIQIFEEKKLRAKNNAVFPCVLKIIESDIYNKKNPLIMGVEIMEGNLHLLTPLIILPSKTYIGKVIGIQINKKDIQIGVKGQRVCIKIDNQENPNISYGRHFTHTDILYSNISKKSIDILKEYFKKDVSKDDIKLMIELKKLIGF